MLFEDGDISEGDKKKFYEAVREFYVDAANQALLLQMKFLTMPNS